MMDGSSASGVPVVLGIDLGTSSVKVAALCGSSVVAEASKSYEISSPQPGWREIDPALWWGASKAAVAEVASRVDGEISAIGVTGQMHTLVPLDAEGAPVRPALMWNDVRTADLVPRVRERLNAAGEDYLARLVSTGSPAANLVWLKTQEPASFAKLDRFLIGPDWIVFKLTGSVETDYCEASTSSLFNLEERAWSERACVFLGIPPSILPPVRGAAQVAGHVDDGLAKELGIPAGIPVVHGTGDNPAAAVTTGCLVQGRTVISLGTSGVLMARRDAPDFSARGKNILFSADGKDVRCLVQGAIQSCGSTRSWLIERILQASSYDGVDGQADASRAGTGELLFFPHMTGEKTLFADPSLRGAFIGLTPETSRADLDLAVMEGIAYGFRQLASEMAIPLDGREPLLAVGGGARSSTWLQVLADVLKCPIQRVEGPSGAAVGAAVLALTGALGCPEPEVVSFGAVFEPGAAADNHDRKYERYLHIREALKSIPSEYDL